MAQGSCLDHHSSLFTASLFPPIPQSERAVDTWVSHISPCSETSLLSVKDEAPTWPRELHAICPRHLTSVPTLPLAHSAPATLASCCSSNTPERFPPQGLCTGYSLCLEHSSCRSHVCPSVPPSFLQVLAEMSSSQGGFADCIIQDLTSSIAPSFLSPFFNIYQHLANSSFSLFLFFLICLSSNRVNRDFVSFVCCPLLYSQCLKQSRCSRNIFWRAAWATAVAD